MKKTLALILSLLLLFAAIPVFADRQPFYTFWIVQDNRVIDCASGEIQLQRTPFSIFLNFPQPMGILVAATDRSKRYRLAKNGAPLKAFIKPATGMAEGLYNENHDIMLSAVGTNYWYYESANDHRFNKVAPENGRLICERLIENIWDTDGMLGEQKIEETGIKYLYLVFVAAEYQADTYGYREIQRGTLRIRFKNEQTGKSLFTMKNGRV